MLYILLFVSELVVLFFLSRRVQRRVGFSLLKLTGSRKVSVYVMSILFLPGTFIHEIAHFLAALFLLVPVGNLELIPKIEEDSIKMGSVSIAKTDPLRRFLIGAAPFFAGTATLLLSLYYFLIINDSVNLQEVTSIAIWKIVILIYLIFTITNTMFSSKKDMEGMWGFLAVIVFTAVILWVFDINLNLSFVNHPKISELFSTASFLLLVPLVLDIITVAVLPKK